MIKARIITVLFFCLLIFRMQPQIMWQFKKDTVVTWYYNDGDEFNNNKVNADYWSYWYGWARSIFSNKEQQYYTDGKNHFESNGLLKLSARKEDITARLIDHMKDGDSLKVNDKFFTLNKTNFRYTAGMLQSKKTFLHGFYECRFKMPKQKGYWPAIWLYGGAPNQEIDIMEGKSERESQLHIDTHCDQHCDYIQTFLKKKSWGGWVKSKARLNDEFNVVACEWTPDYIKYYLNGEFIGISKVSFNIPKHFVLNMAVPSNNGPFHPGPDIKDTSTAYFEIDYVRIWDRSESVADKTNKASENLTNVSTDINHLQKTFLKSKKKIHYGKKSDSANEGFFISVFQEKDKMQLITSGKLNRDFPILEIYDENKNLLETRKLDHTFTNVNTSTYQTGHIILKINYENKSSGAKIAIR